MLCHMNKSQCMRPIESRNNHGMTPLLSAAKSGVPEVFEALRLSGANIVSKDKDERNALHVAIERGHMELTLALLKHPELLNAMDRQGNTPLHVAAVRADLDLVKTLLKDERIKAIKNLQGLWPSQMTSNNFVKASIEKRELQQNGLDTVIAKLETMGSRRQRRLQ